jgi:DNA-binding NtrC family response regulator
MTTEKNILIVDDDASAREILSIIVQEWGYKPIEAKDGEDALKRMEKDAISVVLTDVIMPKLGGLELLRRLKVINPNTKLILITAEGTIDLGVEAMKQGAVDFLTKPIDFKKLKILLDNLYEEEAEMVEIDDLDKLLRSGGSFFGLIGRSPAIKSIVGLIRDVASKDAAVLITGESGTGKEVVANAIHQASPRAMEPYIAINASAIPETLIESEIFGHERGAFTGATDRRPGCFELATKGTLFLDEIAEMPLNLQPKLLRVLEEGSVRRLGGRESTPIDVRIIAATNHRPEEAIREGTLRKDLFYRLSTVQVELPPLAQRKEDIPLLVRHFIDMYDQKHQVKVKSISRRTKQIFMSYTWPGNVRELRNVIERAVIVAKSEWIEPQDLPPYLTQITAEQEQLITIKPGTTFSEAEREIILRTLKAVDNNKAEAARVLGVDVKTIRNKLKAYGIADLESAV